VTASALAAPRVSRTLGPVRATHIAAFAVVLAAAYVAGPAVFFTACAAVLLWSTASSPAERVLALVLPVAFRIALALGVFHFEPPTQIVDLATRGSEPLSLFIQQDLWWPRYLVAYPSMAAADHWGLRFADAFALYCAALLPVSAMVLLAVVRVWRRMDEVRAFAVGLGFAVVIGAIATQMNGRLIPAHIGMGVILLALAGIVGAERLGLREGILLGVGTILSHMTSGTGLVAFAVLVAGSLLIVALRIDPARMLALLWLMSVAFGPLLFSDFLKNVDFYGGGVAAIVTMLDHGPGVLLRRQPWTIVGALAAVFLAVSVAWRSRARLLATPRPLWPVGLAVPVTAIGGLYGFSTLSMAIPALLILFMAAAVGRTSRPGPA
jgi:hypothetical protein